MIGQKLAHYQIQAKLGQGGMGEVFLALDTRLNRKVALKLLPESMRDDAVSRKRLVREAQAAATLDHPFICKIYEADEWEGQVYIAMEYVEGKTLYQRLKEGPLPLKELVHTMSETAEALEVAHEHGVVHRDLKPSNIMVGRGGHVKVMDFGLAKQLDSQAVVDDQQTLISSLTAAGAIAGTIDYMSPEQLRRQAIDTRSDIFALGTMLYEAAVGAHPFRKESPLDTVSAILAGPPVSITRPSAAMPSLLGHIIRKALARDPGDRYQTVRDLRADLRLVRAEGTSEVGRRLAAIMMTDIVGYSRLTQRNEVLAMQLLEEHWRLLRPIFAKHEGQEIKTIGDAFLVEFPSALQATRCAIAVQKALHERNAATEPDRCILLRIGLHLGDVIHQENDVFGDGVNIASRIEPIAEPGGICVSEDVAHQVRNKIELPLAEILENLKLKNIERPIRAFRVVLPWAGSLAGAGSAAPAAEVEIRIDAKPLAGRPEPQTGASAGQTKARRLRALTRPKHWLLGFASALALVAIAFLLFSVLNPKPVLSFVARDWILVSDFENQTGDMMLDKSLGTAFSVSMSQSKHANVYSRTRAENVLRRMGKRLDVPIDEEVGREICQRENIRGLVCPTIGKIGSQFLITARIVDPKTGDAVRSYSEKAADYNKILPALDSIAESVRNGLGESLAAVQLASRPLQKVTTSSLEALKAYSDGQYQWGRGQNSAGVELMRRAVKLDPDFAMAHSALGVFLSSFVFNNLPEGKLHFEKALRLTDRTTEREAQVVRLEYESHFGDDQTSRNLFELYLQNYPDSTVQRYNYGGFLRDHGEVAKAIEQYKELLRIAPEYAGGYINLATCYSLTDRFQDALTTYDRAFKLEPTWKTSRNLNHEYGFVFVALGDYPKARQVFTEALSTPSKPGALRSLALLDLHLGKYKDARSKLQEAILLNVSDKALLNEGRNHVFMSIVLEGQGDLTGVRQELDKAAACIRTLPPLVWMDVNLGIGYARLRAAEKAVEFLDKARKEVNPKDAAENSYFKRLEGEIELMRGRPAAAIELLLIADRTKRGPGTLISLARAYQIGGKTDEAITSYEALVGLGHRAEGQESQQDWLAAHLELAKLYLAQKEPQKAQNSLSKLLTYWKEADPDLPAYQEALRLSKSL